LLEGTGDNVPFNILKLIDPRKIDNLNSFYRIASLVIIFSSILLISWLSSNHRASNFYKDILPHNQQYTALYFNNTGSLPVSVPRNNRLSVSFSIVNDEGKVQHYQYLIVVISKTKEIIVKRGELTLASNHKSNVRSNFGMPAHIRAKEILISLPAQRESIYLLLKESAV